jgi:acyl carrier protein
MSEFSPEQILQELRRLAAAETGMGAAAERIGRDTRLSELGMDSLAAAGFVVEVEVRFGISLPPLLLFEAKTVGDVVDRVGTLVGARRS